MKIKLILLAVIILPYFSIAQQLLEKNNSDLVPKENDGENYVFSQDQSYLIGTNASNYPDIYHVITDVPKDFVGFGSSIFSKENIEPLLLLTTVTAGLIVTDHKTYLGTKKFLRGSKTLDSFSHTFVEVGDAKWHLGLSVAALMFGYFSNDKRLQNTAFQTAEAVIASGLFVQLLKRISGRESPAVHTTPGGYWDIFPDPGEYQHRQPEYYAFPSGHITSATAFLTVISENYPDVKWIKPVSYVIIGLLGVSLFAQDMHWYSDLPLGIAIGYSFGKIISSRYSIEDENVLSKKNISIMPFIANENYSISISYGF